MTSLFKALFLAFIALDAQAEGYNLLVCTSRKYALSRSQAVAETNKATRQMDRELGTRWRRRGLQVKACSRVNRDWRKVYNGDAFGALRKNFPKNWDQERNYNLAIIPALEDGPRRGIGGIASDVCGMLSHSQMTIAALTPKNHMGEDRLTEASTIIAHELGHQIGCDHDDTLPATVMHSNVAPYVKQQNGVVFGNLCRKEKKWCQEEVNYWRKRGWIK